MNSSSFNINDISSMHKKMKETMDKSNNPNGSENHVVRLDNIIPGEIIVMRQFFPGSKPIEVARMMFQDGQNRLSLDKDFVGLVIGKPKKPEKKFEIVYVGFSDDEIKKFADIEQIVNRN